MFCLSGFYVLTELVKKHVQKIIDSALGLKSLESNLRPIHLHALRPFEILMGLSENFDNPKKTNNFFYLV